MEGLIKASKDPPTPTLTPDHATRNSTLHQEQIHLIVSEEQKMLTGEVHSNSKME